MHQNLPCEMCIRDSRHPVVEQMLKGSLFVPNDTTLNCTTDRCLIITGPNMAGKSTYMRQNALIALMAQIGSFVPASSCHVGVVDAIFTRIGASEDVYKRQVQRHEWVQHGSILRAALPAGRSGRRGFPYRLRPQSGPFLRFCRFPARLGQGARVRLPGNDGRKSCKVVMLYIIFNLFIDCFFIFDLFICIKGEDVYKRQEWWH